MEFRTHAGDTITGQPLLEAFGKVADFWENNAHAIYAEDGYGSHVSEKTKRDCLERQLSQAERIRAGSEPMGFWLWQRVNTELTGECVGFLPKTEKGN